MTSPQRQEGGDRGGRDFSTGVALTMFATIVWGAQFPIAKEAFAHIDPYHISLIRYLLATALAIPVLIHIEGARALAAPTQFGLLGALAIAGMTLSPLLVFGGLELSRPEHVAIIVALQPSMTALADWWLNGRRPRRFTLGCISVAFLGVVIVVSKGRFVLAETPRELAGDFMALLGAACWVAYTLGRERIHGYSTFRFTTLSMLVGTVGLLVACAFGVFAGVLSPVTTTQIGASAWQIAFLAVVGVFLGMPAWNAGLRRIGVLNGMLFQNLVPTATFSIRAATGYPIEPIEIAGALLVIAALAANNLYLRRASAQRISGARAVNRSR